MIISKSRQTKGHEYGEDLTENIKMGQKCLTFGTETQINPAGNWKSSTKISQQKKYKAALMLFQPKLWLFKEKCHIQNEY